MKTSAIADVRHTDFQDIAEKTINGEGFLHVKGLICHSAMGVEKITSTKSDGTVNVLIHITLAGHGLSGAFEFNVPLADLRTLTFGEAQEPIWER